MILRLPLMWLKNMQIEELKEAVRDALFLDDLGAEKLTDFVRQITYYILNEREQHQLLTVITSNFSIKDLDKQIDSRISSRIAGMCEILKFTGKDQRLKSNDKKAFIGKFSGIYTNFDEEGKHYL